ncbi:MAG: sigma-70 family RNA polymerase sigma factor [Bacteroidaceae bacterium]|jgi:RNA polymerase sigma-70 factor (ECF subfamily)|uniref:RNA polymerase sigma factor n=1 Tax=unclassified Bacteroides TaxID=2646097 RepID=UPI0004E1B44E|nr:MULTISPECIES: sigma-70 family RNA polymerase sigma factor [unclassified Bacteroides]MBP3243622.1 sigma-70 family RNA polymerase sigma factor [Bacteroidaceae bacterium]MBP5221224.1 sigma-70 family RNA polymerase sigma factor [Bacteroidaceae bacterium]MBQ1676717.1 sigma-70 family RNA polymerase sigma factor [Bacteroidaceae bacterium]MBQ2055759.1 sigma-70 family RNA polymerase sigma factor [Bacteroidaceae bacterium]MBQ3874509.1 sigma-70 family RNA polymerase sigma factor [Bacteroidaceae bacter
MKSYKSHSDEELVKLYVQGNNEAFDALLSRYNTKVYNYIYGFVHNEALAEDLFQETFIKAIITLKQGGYSESGKFSSWLMRIAHNKVFDVFRLEKHDNTVSNDEYDVDLYDYSQLLEGNVEDNIVADQTIDELNYLITLLNEDQREIIKMRYYQELSFKEISDITGVSINTALGRMRYAILNLRKLAEEKNMLFQY